MRFSFLLTTLALGACATTAPPADVAPAVAMQWQAPLPHAGELSDLQTWWSQFDDPLLARLVAAAQAASPTLATAAAHIAESRAARVAGDAALLPSLDLGASASRGRAEPGAPTGSVASVGLQAAWELDLFGALRAGADAARARLASREAAWHDARVSVAAEVALVYADLRACELQRRLLDDDARSRALSADVTEAAARVGVHAETVAALARASADEAQVAHRQQQAQCELTVKSLVALTAQDEPTLRAQLAARTARLPQPREFAVAGVPAAVLAQRPDVQAAARDVAAASADATQAAAQRWPRITLAGTVGAVRSQSLSLSADGGVWTLGPVTVTLPLFDAGRRRADAAAARARHAAALSAYAARLRAAIQEVESALVTLHADAQRSDDASRAAAGYDRAYQATAASYRAGAASLLELEDARRRRLAAQKTRHALQRERLAAWIALYRATGGGWRPAHPTHSTAAES
jgi:multidrug efflux system outer membrane protein